MTNANRDMPIDLPKPVEYRLKLIRTESATGYFSVFPEEDFGFEASLAFARRHPNDEFMRRQLLRTVNGWDAAELSTRITRLKAEDHFLRALFFEACLLNPRFEAMLARFEADRTEALLRRTPLVFLRAHFIEDHGRHAEWIRFFRDNIQGHKPLASPALPELFSADAALGSLQLKVTLPEVVERFSRDPAPPRSGRSPAADISALALQRLERAGVAVGPEKRHESSLSPVALLRQWQVRFGICNGRHHFNFAGEQTAYGRGLHLEDARAACLMEIVERRSAYADIDGAGTVGLAEKHALVHARASEWDRGAGTCLDPNRLTLEAPYSDAPLYWIEAEMQTLEGPIPMWVPAQCVFMFCNLDEVKLFSALGSTGLAAGASLEEAKFRALLEIIERDSECVMPFSPRTCFDLEALSPGIAMLLENYAELGIQVQFQDITTELGVPCCKCFVLDRDGQVVKGTGAHLDAGRALLSALTETPYPYPEGPPSRPALPGRIRVCLESLPDYADASALRDLQVLETLLLENGYHPIYVDLTREDIGLPVVRALVPGMEMLGDFDRFSRVNPRLYGHYLKLLREEESGGR